jgi:hypothetical protein
MSVEAHNFGAKCRLAPVNRPEKDDGMPAIEAQFFYSSVIPIDDPLSTGSIIGGSDAKSPKGQLRPFPIGDNNALEKAWLRLTTEKDRQRHKDALSGTRYNSLGIEVNAEKRSILVGRVASKHWNIHRNSYKPQDVTISVDDALPSTPAPACCAQLLPDVCEELQDDFCSLIRKSDPYLSPELVSQEVAVALEQMRRSSLQTLSESVDLSGNLSSSPPSMGSVKTIATSSFPPETKGRTRSTSLMDSSPRARTPTNNTIHPRLPITDDGISGKPFVRVGDPDIKTENVSMSLPRVGFTTPRFADHNYAARPEAPTSPIAQTTQKATIDKKAEHIRHSEEVAVGISKLHMVSLPKLQMKPIYWSPVNDVAAVMRGTWFYK